jgi:hypothetical protein
VDQLRQHVENIDRLVWQQVREVYRAPLFRDHERMCLAVKWLVDTVQDSGTVLAFGRQEEVWATARSEPGFRPILADLWTPEWTPEGLGELVVVVASRFYPELLDVAEDAEGPSISPPSSRRVMIVPLDAAAPPSDIGDLEPGLAAGVLRAKTTTLILTGGDFLLQPARRLRGRPDRGFDPCTGEVLEEDLFASSAYQVAAAVVEIARSESRCDSTTLNPALQKFGLTCRPLGKALVVMQQP